LRVFGAGENQSVCFSNRSVKGNDVCRATSFKVWIEKC
jgi:hypothetical protein